MRRDEGGGGGGGGGRDGEGEGGQGLMEGGRQGCFALHLLCKAGIAFFLGGCLLGWWGSGGGGAGESILFTSSRFDKARH